MKVGDDFVSRTVGDFAAIVMDSVGGVVAGVVRALRQPGGWRTGTTIRPNNEPNKEETESPGNHEDTPLEATDALGCPEDPLYSAKIVLSPAA